MTGPQDSLADPTCWCGRTDKQHHPDMPWRAYHVAAPQDCPVCLDGWPCGSNHHGGNK